MIGLPMVHMEDRNSSRSGTTVAVLILCTTFFAPAFLLISYFMEDSATGLFWSGLFWFLGSVGVLSIVASINALIKPYETGLTVSDAHLLWWSTDPTCRSGYLALSDIQSIHLDTAGEYNSIDIKTTDGEDMLIRECYFSNKSCEIIQTIVNLNPTIVADHNGKAILPDLNTQALTDNRDTDHQHQKQANPSEADASAEQNAPPAFPTDHYPLELQYTLTLRPRLAAYWHSHPALQTTFAKLTLGVALLMTVAEYLLIDAWWVFLIFLAATPLSFGLFAGLFRTLCSGKRTLKLTFEKFRLTIHDGRYQTRMPFTSLTHCDPLPPGYWTLQHGNGAFVTLPQDLLNDTQINFLQDKAAHYRTICKKIGIPNLPGGSALK